VEADDSRALSRGIQRLTIRAAIGLNRRLGRRSGKLWTGRHHRHTLKSPREVRRALVYVLTNFRKHRSFGAGDRHCTARLVDPYSSASWFDGWLDRRGRPPPVDIPLPVLPPTTWLLSIGWRRHGLVSIEEAPASEWHRADVHAPGGAG
jgi:hypothetical protein